METILCYDKITDLTHLIWDVSRESSGTAGSYLKSYEVINGIKYYYKMSRYDTVNGIIGHECFNEIICMNIAKQLGIDCLEYELIHCNVIIDNKTYETFVTKSQDFKCENDKKLALGDYYSILKEDESPYEFMLRMGYDKFCYNMFTLDYLIYNRDRHSSNIEVLYNNGIYRMAPLFDHGLSFMCTCNEPDEFISFDKLKNGPVNNFIGSKDLSENLKLVPKDILARFVKPTNIFEGLDIYKKYMPNEYWEQLQLMFDMRCEYVKTI